MSELHLGVNGGGGEYKVGWMNDVVGGGGGAIRAVTRMTGLHGARNRTMASWAGQNVRAAGCVSHAGARSFRF